MVDNKDTNEDDKDDDNLKDNDEDDEGDSTDKEEGENEQGLEFMSKEELQVDVLNLQRQDWFRVNCLKNSKTKNEKIIIIQYHFYVFS